MRIGIDTGGTFTDFVVQDNGESYLFKLASTPANPGEALLQGLRQVAATPGNYVEVIHGTTVATNAILEQNGAKVGLLCNTGFEDIIEIARQNRSDLYTLMPREPYALVEPHLRVGVPGRVTCSGQIIEDFDHEKTRHALLTLLDSGAEAIAVCFLYSFLRPDHEKAAGLLIAECCPGIPFTLSHELVPEYREYERLSTTVVNSYILPKVATYVRSVQKGLVLKSFSIMQSSGGSISVSTAAKQPVRTVFSGPAAGVVAAWNLAQASGDARIISFDMGGTSTDVALVDQRLPIYMEARIGSHPLRIPSLNIHTVGAGGGSIARQDRGGALKVGPESAGSDPGPACYGKGSLITVTDANLYLGRLLPDRMLGGNMRLYTEHSYNALECMSKEIGIKAEVLAEGIVEISNLNIEQAIRKISVEKGYNPQDFALVCFGGAGALHAAEIAASLRIARSLIPTDPGAFSATGLLMADCVKDASCMIMADADAVKPEVIQKLYNDLETELHAAVEEEGYISAPICIERSVDMRYKGQSFELNHPYTDDLVQDFHAIHKQIYGHSLPGYTVEIVCIRVRLTVITNKKEKKRVTLPKHQIMQGAEEDSRVLIYKGKKCRARVFNRDYLTYGNRIAGPAIVTEYSSTTFVPPGFMVEVDDLTNLIIAEE